MSLGKKDISKNISSKALLSSKISSEVLEAFLNFVKENKNQRIKISNFGTFYLHQTPSRIGRNPKTKQEFKIQSRKRLSLKVSNKTKIIIN